MNKIVLLALPILATILLAGCSGPGGIYDCGSNLQCFQQRADKCEPAKLTFTNTSQSIYVPVNIRAKAEVQGGSTDACKYYFMIEDISPAVLLPPNQQQLFNSTFGAYEGKDLTCILPASSYKKPPLLPSLDADSCNGTLKDLVNAPQEVYAGAQVLHGAAFQVVDYKLTTTTLLMVLGNKVGNNVRVNSITLSGNATGSNTSAQNITAGVQGTFPVTISPALSSESKVSITITVDYDDLRTGITGKTDKLYLKNIQVS